jgi:hypothetical protein
VPAESGRSSDCARARSWMGTRLGGRSSFAGGPLYNRRGARCPCSAAAGVPKARIDVKKPSGSTSAGAIAAVDTNAWAAAVRDDSPSSRAAEAFVAKGAWVAARRAHTENPMVLDCGLRSHPGTTRRGVGAAAGPRRV